MMLSVCKLVIGAGLGYVALVLLLAGCQRRMIYHPARDSENDLRQTATRAGLTPWLDRQGKLIGWRTPDTPENDNPNVIVFHGNAGYALHRTYFVDGFTGPAARPPWNVHLFEYPGYGARDGRPSESTIKKAALEAVTTVLEHQTGALYLVGESLGCGVASHLAAQKSNQIAGLLLITPYPNLVEVARHHYPFLPVSWFMRDRYYSTGPLQSFNNPAAFILAGRDKVIPPELGRELFDSYDGPKQLWIQENQGHNTLDYHPAAGWWNEVIGFLLEN